MVINLAARRRGLVRLARVLLLIAPIVCGACKNVFGPVEPGGGSRSVDADVFQECTSLCLRPSDCAQAFADRGTCPPGFLCALRFQCGRD
jgi:hypothetical protein